MAGEANTGARLSVDARLALLEELERREAGTVRKAATVAWLSLGAAALLLALVIFGAWAELGELRGETDRLRQERTRLAEATKKQHAELTSVESQLRDKRAALSTLIGAVRRTDDRSRSGLGTALDADPTAQQLVPRVYVHIAEEGDLRWARNLSDRLQVAGIIPLGIENVPAAANLTRFEVRYYKKTEQAVAERLVSEMARVNVPAVPVYLNLETNTKVRPNHYEIWCPPNARAFKLAPLGQAAPG
jgi:hypothetical protein